MEETPEVCEVTTFEKCNDFRVANFSNQILIADNLSV